MAVGLWLVGLAGAIGVGAATAYPWLDRRFGYFVDDGLNHAVRLYVFDHLLRRDPLVYPWWWPDLTLGYGLPLLEFYSPASYYLSEIALLISGDVYRTLQWMGGAYVLAGSLGAYALGVVVAGHPLAGLVTALAYVGSPYPFVTNLYQRSALPEALGQALLPWVLLTAWHAVRRPGRRSSAAVAAALAVAVLSHSLTALIACGALVPWVAAAALSAPQSRRRAGLVTVGAGLALGLVLTAFFWVPALAERGAVHAELGAIGNLDPLRSLYHPFAPGVWLQEMAVPQPYEVTQGWPFDVHWTYPHASHGVPGPPKPSLAQAILLGATTVVALAGWLSARSHRGAGTSGAPAGLVTATGATATTGATGATATTGAIATATQARAGATHVHVAGACAALASVTYALQTVWSEPVWRTVPLLATLQFPWRLLGLLALAIALGCASVYAWLHARGREQWVLALVLGGFVAANGLANRAWPDRFGDTSRIGKWHEQLTYYAADRVAPGTLTGGEFLPRSVVLPEPIDMRRGNRSAYEEPFPAGGWIGGKVWPYAGMQHVSQVWEAPRWTEALVTVPGTTSATLGVKTLVFPGVRAYLDGRPVALRPAPFDPIAGIGHGFVLVDVPPGTHRVQVAVGDSFWRLVGAVVSAVAAGGLVAVLVPDRGGWIAPGPIRLPLSGVVPVAGGVTLAGWLVLTYCVALFSAPHAASPAHATLVVNLAEPSAAVEYVSPVGSGSGAFVDVRDATVDGHARRWLYMHPASEARTRVTLPPRAVFQAALALEEGAWDAAGADGVRFLVEVTDGAGRMHRVLDEVVEPQARAADRGWRFAQVDLGAFAGETVTLTLRTDGRDTPDYDWAGWGSPAIYVDRSALYPPPASVTPARRRLPRQARRAKASRAQPSAAVRAAAGCHRAQSRRASSQRRRAPALPLRRVRSRRTGNGRGG